MTPIRLHHAGSMWWCTSMRLLYVLQIHRNSWYKQTSQTYLKHISNISQTDLAVKPKLPLFLTFYPGLGSSSVKECAFGVWHQIPTNWRAIRNNMEQPTVSPQCCTSAVCACSAFTLRGVRRAVRLKTEKPSNMEQLSVQLSDSFVAVLNCGVASLILIALCTHIIPLQPPEPPQPLLSLQPANACQ